MLKLLFCVGAIMLALQADPSTAQVPSAPPAQAEQILVGLPLITSDGQHLGHVVEPLVVDGQVAAIRVEIGSFLGLGTTMAFIPTEQYRHRGDRIELLMTADEVRDTVAKQRKPTGQLRGSWHI